MADDQPPWATKKYNTPPASGGPAGTVPRSEGPDVTKYSTPPPSPPPPPPPSDPYIRDLTDPSWDGSARRFQAGLAQGFILDPIEKLGELTGIGQNPPKWLEDRLEATREAAGRTLPGEAGRVTGVVTNPLWRLFPALKAGEYAGPTARALTKLANSIFQGAVGGASQPTGAKTPAEAAKQTVPQLLEGGGISGALGIPGAASAWGAFENLRQPVREFVRDMPLEFRRLDRLRNLGRARFTNWWHEQSLEPIGGKVPGVASKETMDKVGMQIGGAIDRATALMSLDVNNPAVSKALGDIRGDAAYNLATSGNAFPTYQEILHNLVDIPLSTNANKLSPAKLRQITSNLAARIRKIDSSVSPDNAALKHELENYRLAMFDNAKGGDKELYRKAREAWRRHAIGVDSQVMSESSGHIDPDRLAAEMNRRNKLRYPRGGGPRGRPDPLQRAVNQAQIGWSMPGAARAGKAGVPLREPGDFAYSAGRVGNIVMPTQEQADQPMRYTWPDQNQ